jgi:hypothetical protein
MLWILLNSKTAVNSVVSCINVKKNKYTKAMWLCYMHMFSKQQAMTCF